MDNATIIKKPAARRRFGNVPLYFCLAFMAVLLATALFPSLFVTSPPLAIDSANVLSPPSFTHWLGTDEVGRDIWSRIVAGARNTVLIGIGSAGLAGLIGVPLGIIAGYYRGRTDGTVRIVVDTMLSFPAMLLAILIVSAWKPNPLSLIAIIALVNFPRFTMIVRSNALSLKEREYVLAARLSGASSMRIMFLEMLPNCMTPIIVQGSLMMASAILIETGLSYFGLGIQPPDPSWGGMLSTAQNYLALAPWYSIAPGLVILVTVMAINIAGDHLRDRLDVRR